MFCFFSLSRLRSLASTSKEEQRNNKRINITKIINITNKSICTVLENNNDNPMKGGECKLIVTH